MWEDRAITNAYRRLYRCLLQAVQYTIPARFVVRDQLRAAFRDPNMRYDENAIKRTVWFLEAAAREKGMEHKILKNLVKVQLGRAYHSSWQPMRGDISPMGNVKMTAYQHYDMTVAMLNKTMGILLR
ncbi:uncharacterized protein NECHADRAFT_102535 [Fusarium vanettenii 77-13-4]|uniref:Uncharacterized protein n=1 Tax=Fusarium vanettenii (strain ATCC MYA-4622 / CBS 123669 / FGSC 9596 / NRRL 45880 / 77-13-4) TaxID=660122 RepID=C7YPR5_FUSV7|nr:uncharacterized protein NECHADRAFT_102535 [Fusarium vanettenii 77-13-4]EEU45896.1 hypothetical protein NECHADRAFT_102535 [Fusarium vanettenii 77-13-4]